MRQETGPWETSPVILLGLSWILYKTRKTPWTMCPVETGHDTQNLMWSLAPDTSLRPPWMPPAPLRLLHSEDWHLGHLVHSPDWLLSTKKSSCGTCELQSGKLNFHFLWNKCSSQALASQAFGLPRWHSGKESACQCRRHKSCRAEPLIYTWRD